jgi:hypothetical protein
VIDEDFSVEGAVPAEKLLSEITTTVKKPYNSN